MWAVFLTTIVFSTAASKHITKRFGSESIFRDDQIIFTSHFNITKVLVPSDGKYIQSNDIPSIFFTISDPKLDGGSCIYVLEGFAAYEVLEGGRDSTTSYGSDKGVYFGAIDGIYKYSPDTLSAKKFGVFRDNIIQIQKANGSDAIYILTYEHKLFKLENNATVRTKITAVVCALEFVLDTNNNIYYIGCHDRMPHIVKSNGLVHSLTASVMEEFKQITLLRPAFVMEDCIPFFGDGNLYILYANGTSEKKEFQIQERPTAFSVDAALYIVAALDGRLYEFNVMEVLLKSMFGLINEWPHDITKVVSSMMDTAKESIYNHINI